MSDGVLGPFTDRWRDSELANTLIEVTRLREELDAAFRASTAERERLERDLERERAGGAEQLVEATNEAARLRKLLDAPPYVDCLCGGCPRRVPQAWLDGMCESCADEDCEHTDGARAVQAERDELRVEVEQLRAQVAASVHEVNRQLAKVGVFDDVRRLMRAFEDVRQSVAAFDAREIEERRRATAEMVRDSETDGVNHREGQR